MALPSLPDQAERLVRLGVHDLSGIPADLLHEVAASGPSGSLLVTSAPASELAPLLRLGDKPGFVVEDLTDVDDFAPTVEVPAAPYVVVGLDRGDAFLNRTPAESVPEVLAAGRSPLTLAEGLHWVLQDPDVLERNACFMTPGSRLRRAERVVRRPHAGAVDQQRDRTRRPGASPRPEAGLVLVGQPAHLAGHRVVRATYPRVTTV